jgi:hypothetical protein
MPAWYIIILEHHREKERERERIIGTSGRMISVIADVGIAQLKDGILSQHLYD